MKQTRNPFRELERLFEQMQANFEEGTMWWEPTLEAGDEETSVRVDLEDTGEEFVLHAELPGFSSDNIDIVVSDQTFRLEAEHDEELEEADGEFLRRERRHQSVSRSLTLPDAVDTEGIVATFNNGILTVEMPKREPTAHGTHIDIE